MEVGTVAADASTGIYLQELTAGGNLVIGHASNTLVTVNVIEVDFRSTTSAINEVSGLDERDDLTTANGPIKVRVDNGTLQVTDGTNLDGVGVFSRADR